MKNKMSLEKLSFIVTSVGAVGVVFFGVVGSIYVLGLDLGSIDGQLQSLKVGQEELRADLKRIEDKFDGKFDALQTDLKVLETDLKVLAVGLKRVEDKFDNGLNVLESDLKALEDDLKKLEASLKKIGDGFQSLVVGQSNFSGELKVLKINQANFDGKLKALSASVENIDKRIQDLYVKMQAAASVE